MTDYKLINSQSQLIFQFASFMTFVVSQKETEVPGTSLKDL